jgi:hypothetical protein
VDDELVKVVRLRGSGDQPDMTDHVPRSFRGRPPALLEDFAQHIISPVVFAPLLQKPSMRTVIESRVWDPSINYSYPESFRKSCREILLCNQAPKLQPPPKVPIAQINVASQLPKDLWVKILSFAQRDWFDPPESEVGALQRQLEAERQAVQRARNAQRDAETRLHIVERERDGFRLLALRWRTRLQAASEQQQGTFPSLNDELLALDDVMQLFSDPEMIRLGGINAVIRRLHDDSSDDDEEEQDDESSDEGQEAMDAESDDEMSTGSMEDATADLPPQDASVEAAIQFRSARTVSIASSDP